MRDRYTLGRFVWCSFVAALCACTFLLLLTDDTRTEDPSPVTVGTVQPATVASIEVEG